MQRIKFNELKHMDMIYYVRGKIVDGKVHIIKEIRFVQNPKSSDGFVWIYKMIPNDPCIKIRKEHVAICVHPDESEKGKHTDFLRSEFKRQFVYDKFVNAGAKGGSISRRVLSSEQAKEMAKKLLTKSSAILALVKQAATGGAGMSLPDGLDYEAQCFALCFATEDQKEGMKAFMEKRKPEYKNR